MTNTIKQLQYTGRHASDLGVIITFNESHYEVGVMLNYFSIVMLYIAQRRN